MDVDISFLSDRQLKILDFVKEDHGKQVRKYTGEPYWHHPVAVAKIVGKYLGYGDSNLMHIEAALCHDLIEDVYIYSHPLQSRLIKIPDYSTSQVLRIMSLTISLTDIYTKESFPEHNRKKRKELEAIRLGDCSKIVQTIKYADLYDNTFSIVGGDSSFAKVYLKEKDYLLKQMKDGDRDLRKLCLNQMKDLEYAR